MPIREIGFIGEVEFIGQEGSGGGSGGGGESYVASAVLFPVPDVEVDEANLARGAGLTGVTSYSKLLFSVWAKIPNLGEFKICGNFGGSISIKIQPAFGDSIYSDIYDAGFNGDSMRGDWPSPDTGWHHFIFSYDRTNKPGSLVLVDGVDVSDLPGWFNTGDPTLVEDDANFLINPPATAGLNGCEIADLYIAFNQWLDLSVPANVEKFRSVAGKPVFLGADGSVPTGTAPTIFLSGDASEFHINKGTGGGFTVTQGALVDAATSPSD